MLNKNSVNESELDKFRKISSQWWDPDGELKALHDINPARINYILHIIRNHFQIGFSKLPQKYSASNQDDNTDALSTSLKNLKLLDVGCGGGIATIALYKAGMHNITALDAASENIEVAKLYASQHRYNINYVNDVAENLTETYDIVICLEVLEHVDNLDSFIVTLSNLVNKGGLLIMSTINRNLKSYLGAILLAEYVLKLVPPQTHDYNKFIKPDEIADLLNSNNMQIKEFKGLRFNLINQIFELSSDLDINYFVCAEKL